MSVRSVFLGLALLGVVACNPAKTTDTESDQVSNDAAGIVNIYSSRHYDTDLRLYSDFTEQTGIKVNRIEAKSNALIERLKTEGAFSPADLLITVDAGVFWRAENEGVIQPVSSTVLETRIPSHLRHPKGLWYGLSKRARVIIYNKDKGRPEKLESYSDLADPSHEGTICMRSSGNIYNISLLSSFIANLGEAEAKDWAASVVRNFARKPQSNDTGQIEAVASGFPNQNGRGTHVNISGAAVTAHAPNKENAIRFMEYLTSESAQRYFADGNNEYPVIDLDDNLSAVQALGTFNEDTLNVGQLGEQQAKAIEIYDSVGLIWIMK